MSEIVLNVPEDLVVYCNRLKLGQVLINIIVNAAQVIKSQERSKKGCITISADNEGAYINIYVTDDGPGIPQKNLNKIFDPFFTTKEAGQGTGLGLSISYDIITTSHGGMLLVNSEVGIGTTFTIKLPNITERIE
ncbi:MAG: HAMP domain-containing histidine kinase [Clostridiaceae bacterium]|nr:HAMP domain-containing histidine kinase [Clostridiaceae bacterium]